MASISSPNHSPEGLVVTMLSLHPNGGCGIVVSHDANNSTFESVRSASSFPWRFPIHQERVTEETIIDFGIGFGPDARTSRFD